MLGDVTDGIMPLASLVIIVAASVWDTPPTLVTDVILRAVGVLQALGGAPRVVDACLPIFTVTGLGPIFTLPIIGAGPDTSGTVRPVVELFIEGKSPLEARAALTHPVTV